MSSYAHIKRCLEVSDRDITSAIGERRLAKALLDQLSRVSKPGDGAPKLLLVFARIAGQQAEWIDGALRVELLADAGATIVDVLAELGAGMSERVFPSFRMSVPLEEFARAVERVPHMIAPLSVASASAGRLVLSASEGGDEGAFDEVSVSVPIAAESMYAGDRRTSSKGRVALARQASERPKGLGKSMRPDEPPASTRASLRAAAPRTGKTLRPAPPPPAAPRSPPLVVPRPPGLPRAEARAVEGARPVTRGSRPPPSTAAPALKRASKPPAKRASVKPPPSPKRASSRPSPASRAASKSASRTPSARPPRSAAPARTGRTGASEPPDEEGVDTGWDDDA